MTKRKHGWAPLSALVVALVVGSTGATGCVTDDNGLPVDCIYSADYACWACGGVAFEEVYRTYHVACRALGDCQAFCGAIPTGWRGCGGAGDYCAPLGSRGLARGTLAGCGSGRPAGPDYFDIPSYHCFFCFSSKQAHAVVVTPSGACRAFADLCLPPEDDLLPQIDREEIPTRCNNAVLPDAGGVDMARDAAVPRDAGSE